MVDLKIDLVVHVPDINLLIFAMAKNNFVLNVIRLYVFLNAAASGKWKCMLSYQKNVQKHLKLFS